METYRDQTFQNKSFVLEESSFVKCVLKSCDLYYGGGDFDWTETNFENCRFHWRGAAKNTVILLQTIGALKPQTMPVNLIPASSQKPN